MTTTYFVTRHSGAIEWLRAGRPEIAANAIAVAHWTTALTEALQPGDTVIGILPVDIAADVCDRGAKFFSLSLPRLTPEMRGRELTADEMSSAGARIEEFSCRRLPVWEIWATDGSRDVQGCCHRLPGRIRTYDEAKAEMLRLGFRSDGGVGYWVREGAP